MPTMSTSDIVPEHQHQCAKCGEEFTATCGHLLYEERSPRHIECRPAKANEYPHIVASCEKAECAFRGF